MYDAMVYAVMSKWTITKNTAGINIALNINHYCGSNNIILSSLPELFLDSCITFPFTNDAASLTFVGHQAHSHNMGRVVSAYQNATYQGNQGQVIIEFF